MQAIAKSVKRQVRTTEASHIVKTTIILSQNAVVFQKQVRTNIVVSSQRKTKKTFVISKIIFKNRLKLKTMIFGAFLK